MGAASNSSAAAAATSAAAKQQLLYDGIALDMDGTLTSCVIDFVGMRKRTGAWEAAAELQSHAHPAIVCSTQGPVTSVTLSNATTAFTPSTNLWPSLPHLPHLPHLPPSLPVGDL